MRYDGPGGVCATEESLTELGMKQMREERERRGRGGGEKGGGVDESASAVALFLFTGASKRDQITASLVEGAGMVQSVASPR